MRLLYDCVLLAPACALGCSDNDKHGVTPDVEHVDHDASTPRDVDPPAMPAPDECPDGKPFLVEGTPTGFEICAGSEVHRAESVECDPNECRPNEDTGVRACRTAECADS